MPDAQLPRVGVAEVQSPLGSRKDWERKGRGLRRAWPRAGLVSTWGSGLQLQWWKAGSEGGRWAFRQQPSRKSRNQVALAVEGTSILLEA